MGVPPSAKSPHPGCFLEKNLKNTADGGFINEKVQITIHVFPKSAIFCCLFAENVEIWETINKGTAIKAVPQTVDKPVSGGACSARRVFFIHKKSQQ